MKNMTLQNITSAVGGRLYFAEQCDPKATPCGIVIDSRQVTEGMIFVAIKGERVDGHRFIDDVFAKGAMAVICQDLPQVPKGPCIQVEDCCDALKKAAAYYRPQLNIKVVGITGSVGKTSTKEFVAGVLAAHYKVHKTAGNFNNEVGLPLTIFQIRDEHEIAVLEMGINSFGEMHRLSEVAKPDLVVMTNIGQCHLENLIDRDGVLRAKSEIFDFMNPEGIAIVNGDDDKLVTIGQVNGKKTVTFGLKPENDVFADHIENKGLFGSHARLHLKAGALGRDSALVSELAAVGAEIEAEISLPGEHMILNAMAASAAGRLLGLTEAEIARGISSVQPVAGRSHLIKTDKYVLIDDCYNANPVSMKAAIDLLVSSGTRNAAILGDMFELGSEELTLHGGVGRYAAESGVDVLCCVGELSRSMYEAAKSLMEKAYWFEDKEALMGALPEILEAGDTVLIKASHSMAFEKIVEKLSEAQ